MMSALGNGLHTSGTRQRQGACHIWQMLGPQMSAARAPIARRADTLFTAGLCVWSPSWQRILLSHTASALNIDVATAVAGARPNSRAAAAVTPVPSALLDTVHEFQCEQRRSRAAIQVRSRDRNPRPNWVPLEAAGRETCMKESSSTSRVR